MHRLRPLSLREANTYVIAHHRHSKRVLCHKFSIGLEADGDLVGVAIVALPIARGLADGFTAEVRRVCTLGHPNACSILYSAARKTALAMGFTRIVTYIREDELGTSLKAAGWHPVQVDRRRNHWDDHPRPASAQERVQRVRWEAGTTADPPAPALAPRARVKLPREQRRHIAKRLAQDGWSQQRIAVELCVSQATVSRDLDELCAPDNSDKPKRGRPRSHSHPSTCSGCGWCSTRSADIASAITASACAWSEVADQGAIPWGPEGTMGPEAAFYPSPR